MRKIFSLVFIIFLFFEYYIYSSDLNLTKDLTVQIALVTILISVFFSIFIIKNKIAKIVSLIAIVILAIMFLTVELIAGGLKGATDVSRTWNINEFEIQSVYQSPFAGSGYSYIILREKYFFGMFYKNLDETFPDDYTEITKNNCIVRFKHVNKVFDLCKSKQIK